MAEIRNIGDLPHKTSVEACQTTIGLIDNPPANATFGAAAFAKYIIEHNKSERNKPDDVPDWLWIADTVDLYGLVPDRPLPGPTKGTFSKTPDYLPTLQKVFANSFFDFDRNHSAILDTDTKSLMAAKGISATAKLTLINVDAHSDMKLPGQGGELIADWVNNFLTRNSNVENVYWVVPDEFGKDRQKAVFFPDNGSNDDNLRGSVRDLTLYVGKKINSVSIEKPKDYDEHKDQYRTVQFHKRLISELPIMRGENVILTTDLDYFDNNAHHDSLNARVQFQGQNGLKNYVNWLDNKAINPLFHFVSVSPEYINKEHSPELLKFLAYLEESSKLHRALNFTHEHNFPSEDSPRDGITTQVDGHRGLRLWEELLMNDLKTTQPDGRVVLPKFDQAGKPINPSQEYVTAVKAAEEIYHVRKITAVDILKKLDAADGTLDGIIDLRKIYHAAEEVCRKPENGK